MSNPYSSVSDVMTTAVVSAHVGAAFKDVAAAMARNRVSSVPVLDHDRHVVGMLTAADLLARVSHERGRPPRGHRIRSASETHDKVHAVTAGHLMTAPAVTVSPTDSITAAAGIAADNRVRCMPVVDTDGVLAGIVSKSDLLRVYLRDDDDIRNQVKRDVVDRLLSADPSGAVDVTVHQGIVTFHGCVERRLEAEEIVDDTFAVAGVVDVDVRPSYRVDDVLTAHMLPQY